MPDYSTEKEFYDLIGTQLSEQHDTSPGQMFGKPCLKTGKKAFAAFYQGAMVFKVGREEIAMLNEKYIGSVNWDPSQKGRALKDWLQVPFDYKDDWAALAEQARVFTEEQTK